MPDGVPLWRWVLTPRRAREMRRRVLEVERVRADLAAFMRFGFDWRDEARREADALGRRLRREAYRRAVIEERL